MKHSTETEAELTALHDAIVDRDKRILALVAALEKYGQHRPSRNNEPPSCWRLVRGMAHTQPSDCDCGLYAALRGTE